MEELVIVEWQSHWSFANRHGITIVGFCSVLWLAVNVRGSNVDSDFGRKTGLWKYRVTDYDVDSGSWSW